MTAIMDEPNVENWDAEDQRDVRDEGAEENNLESDEEITKFLNMLEQARGLYDKHEN